MNIWQPHSLSTLHLATVGTQTQTLARISGNIIQKPKTKGLDCLKYHIGRKLETTMINRADAVVTISKFLKDTFQQRGVRAKHFPVISPGVDTKLFHPSKENTPSTSSKKISFVGRMVRNKGIFDLIEAFEDLHHSIDLPVELVLIGDGEDREEAMQDVQEKGLQKVVNFAGHVPHSKLPEFYRQSDVVVLPSWSEAFGNTIVEAQSCRVPVVGTRVGEIPSLLDNHRGILIKPHNPKEISDAVKRVLLDENLSQELAKNGREFVETYHSFDAVRDDYIDLLNRMKEKTNR